MNSLEDLLLALAGAPALPGARCRGRHHLFDDGQAGEDPDSLNARHAQALQLCGACPALERCREWSEGLSKRKRPLGVIGGRLYRSNPVGRPPLSQCREGGPR